VFRKLCFDEIRRFLVQISGTWRWSTASEYHIW